MTCQVSYDRLAFPGATAVTVVTDIYYSSLGQGLHQILELYNQALVEIEKEIKTNVKIPIAGLRHRLSRVSDSVMVASLLSPPPSSLQWPHCWLQFTSIFEELLQFSSEVQSKHLVSGAILDQLHDKAASGSSLHKNAFSLYVTL